MNRHLVVKGSKFHLSRIRCTTTELILKSKKLLEVFCYLKVPQISVFQLRSQVSC